MELIQDKLSRVWNDKTTWYSTQIQTFLLPHLQPQITQVRPLHQGLNPLPPAARKGTAFAKVSSAWRMIDMRS